ncbi:MAG: hypothetical protein CM15mP103_09970 [Gammaproteobacteria bacterium]|nr:MAG: hypothetical protein CM15mP103_09970 [Gammaproteobacteria bacterium]
MTATFSDSTPFAIGIVRRLISQRRYLPPDTALSPPSTQTTLSSGLELKQRRFPEASSVATS